MIPFPEQIIDEHLREQETAVQPDNQLASIDVALDLLNVPRTYPDSPIPCSTRERVRALVYLCQLRGVTWQDSDKFEEVYW